MNYQTLKTILENAPHEAHFWDGSKYLDGKLRESYKVRKYHSQGSYEVTVWEEPLCINTEHLSRLEDLRKIFELMEDVE